MSMRGLIMDYQLTIPAVLRRAEALFGPKTIVSRQPDGTIEDTPTPTWPAG